MAVDVFGGGVDDHVGAELHRTLEDRCREHVVHHDGRRLSLDLRVDRRFSFRSWQLEVYVDVQNVYNRNNISAVRWDPRTNEPEFNESIGVLPTLGINIEF